MSDSGLQTDVLIIGGGLAGLGLAAALAEHGRDFLLVEARNRLGGRILSERCEAGSFDMGPAWFWPGQPRIDAMVKRLGLDRFDQHADGDLLYEETPGRVQRGRGFASMQGSYRLVGGLGALIAALAARIPSERLRLSTPITGLIRDAGGVIATSATGQAVRANAVVLAMPPRIAAQMAYTPPLPSPVLKTMEDVPTWMAGQAKAVAVYERAFWREDGLSGDAMSRLGPMVEIHDASPEAGGPYALFGFLGLPPEARRDEATSRQAVTAQLVRLFGGDAADPKALFIKDWAFDPYTATARDAAPVYAHPRYGLPVHLQNLWDGRVIFGGTEVAPQFGGFLEGALEAAEMAQSQLLTAKV